MTSITLLILTVIVSLVRSYVNLVNLRSEMGLFVRTLTLQTITVHVMGLNDQITLLRICKLKLHYNSICKIILYKI
jgi:hypothetical protein